MGVPTVWLEDANGRRWPMAATCSLGRSSSNDVVIDDGKVSRRHALVHKQDDAEYWVIDLGSGNGTYLNGRRVTQPTRLANGDVLLLGEHALSFHHIAGRAVTEAPSGLSAQTIISVKNVDCWLLVADIKASTALAARLPATEMAMLVGRWMGACKEIVDSHGGIINKFLGDGFFAFWVGPTTETSSVVTALRQLRQLQSDQSGPHFRIAIHHGMVAFGGGGSLGEDSLSGVDVVVAFRMEKIAKDLGADLMASEEVHNRLQGVMPMRDLGVHPVPGLARVTRRFFAIG
ncbi:MAG: FHA domain-containing protein [Hyphomicrobiaceae bacterium]